ncbi:MAG TPA: thiol:disulfide interchange protein DsbA/DsbL, partial [Porticoccaceae bacterium]
FLDNGVSREDFDKTFNSFGVTSAVKQAESRLRGYRTQGTPEIVVNGTYRVSSRMTGGHQGMLDVTTYLIDKIRSEKE